MVINPDCFFLVSVDLFVGITAKSLNFCQSFSSFGLALHGGRDATTFSLKFRAFLVVLCQFRAKMWCAHTGTDVRTFFRHNTRFFSNVHDVLLT